MFKRPPAHSTAVLPAQPVAMSGVGAIAAAVGKGPSFWRRFMAFAGPGYMIAVGYMDPGNWATDIAGGSAFGYTLLSVVMISSLMAVLLQTLSARLGVASGLDLAQACRARYGPRASFALWILAEIGIIACDLAEVLGTAIALKLLFGVPMVYGVCLTGLDVFLILALNRLGFRKLEAFVIALLAIIAGCFAFELFWSKPDLAAVLKGLAPSPAILHDPAMLYLAIGIVGATVMPHNLYLHSALVQTNAYTRDDDGKRTAMRMATLDSNIALTFAFLINAAILILAASTFHVIGRTDVASIEQADSLLAPLLGAGAASIVFGVALLASGQNSTITGTLAGQIVMEGFLHLRMPIWARRLVTRLLAILPAVVVVGVAGESAATKLLVLSQVILSLQLPFAVWPLVQLTGDRSVMGRFVNPRWLAVLSWAVAGLIIVLNITLLWTSFRPD